MSPDRTMQSILITANSKLAMFDFPELNTMTAVDNKCPDGRLPIAVRFILDDFATNVKISEFPRIVSCIRSRGISAMMMIQSEAQLQAAYGEDGQTIISSADTYLYLGGNDLQTAQAVAVRGDIPLDKVLSLPIGECIIFRRGSRPVQARTFRLDEHRDYFQVKENSIFPMIKHGFFR